LVILLFGAPGCGKGTQAAYLTKELGIPAISTGEMFRAECQAGTELGRQAAAIMAAGGLVGDEIVNRMVARRIARDDCARGFLLDGYPRTVPQARYFTRLLADQGRPAPTVIHLDVAADVLLMRLTARRQCSACRRIYNLLLQPPRQPGFCDDDGAALVARDDDREEVIRERLQAYQAQTGPVLQWFGPSGVHRIPGDGEPAQVADAIRGVLVRAAGPGFAPHSLRAQRFASAIRP